MGVVPGLTINARGCGPAHNKSLSAQTQCADKVIKGCGGHQLNAEGSGTGG
jgi:hypothetical protein